MKAKVNEATCPDSSETGLEEGVQQHGRFENGSSALNEVGVPQLPAWVMTIKKTPDTVAPGIEGWASKRNLRMLPQNLKHARNVARWELHVVVDDPDVIVA